jgi:hypothetical protein
MLHELERKLTALVSEQLVVRPHLQVREAPGPTPQLDPGRGAVLVGLMDVLPEAAFEREQFGLIGSQGARRSRRFLPLRFTARLQFFLRPTPAASGLTEARATLLEDLSLTAHALGDESVRSGKAFAAAVPDAGFQVLTFELDKGAVEPELVQQTLAGELRYRGRADIWPPGVSREEGEVRAVDLVLTPLPLRIEMDDPAVRVGGTTRIRVQLEQSSRLVNPETGQRGALRLALAVVSDLPPGQRGAITGGDPGMETGVRLLPVTLPETVVTYTAPAGNPGAARIEFVAIHLATPEGKKGIFLGSAAVRLIAGGA